MKQVTNKTNSIVQLQATFTPKQLELIKSNDLVAPSGFPIIYAEEYRGNIYLTNLMGVVLQIIEPS